MGTGQLSGARACHLAVALLALAGVGIEYAAMVAAHPLAGLGFRTIRFFSFFTILSNLVVAVAGIGATLTTGRWHDRAIRTSTRAAVSVYILVVAVIFQLLLAGLIKLSPLGWWGNMLVHQLVPAGWLLCWFGFPPHGGIARRAPLDWLVFPLAYGVWTIAHGAVSGWYPYPFLDVARHGGGRVAVIMVLMALFFAGLGFAFRWIDGRLAVSRAPA